MPLDAATLYCLKNELESELIGGKIDKVQQPSSDTLIMTVRTLKGTKKILMSAGTGTSRIHFSTETYENPQNPPMFCMLLRKHLIGARITEVNQPGFERMIELCVTTHNELGTVAYERIEVELIGSASNIVLVGNDGRIIDCVRRYGSAESQRALLPGMIYKYPTAQNKILLLNFSSSDGRTAAAASGVAPDKWLLSKVAGISPVLCRELSFRAGESYDTLPDMVESFAQSLVNNECEPNLTLKDGRPLEFSCIKLTHYGECVQYEKCSSFSELLEIFYTRRSKTEILHRNSKELFRIVKNARDRSQRKLIGQNEELKKTEDKDIICRQAELIKANIYKIKKGDKSLLCEDYFDEAYPQVCVQLDPLKTPAQNVESKFKQYNKLKSAERHLSILIRQTEEQLEYLNSVMFELEAAENESDIVSIRSELMTAGYIKIPKRDKKNNEKQQKPLRFLSPEGYEVIVGRNNIQNDELTHKTARKMDYWFHAQKIHGSHVILCCGAVEPKEADILFAAQLAAFYSQGRESSKVSVDYTRVKFVHKPHGSLPGKAVYTDYHTVNIAPAGQKL